MLLRSAITLVLLSTFTITFPPLSVGSDEPTPERKNVEGFRQNKGGCSCCGDRWNWKQEHVTPYSVGNDGSRGCFPLCQECWASMKPKQRLPYYMLLVERWIAQSRTEAEIREAESFREPITKAVLEGK